jgi:transcriptional regulator with XRE-family HTH domain
MTPLQCRAARALLGWTQLDLAVASSVSTDTVRNFETHVRVPRRASLEQMVMAFKAAEVTFIGNGEGLGVMMTKANWPSQFRAARCLLNWSHSDVARASGVSDATVMRFETEQGIPRRASLKVIRRAFDVAGVIFVENNGQAVGVRLRK